jgi:hypothetical protein
VNHIQQYFTKKCFGKCCADSLVGLCAVKGFDWKMQPCETKNKHNLGRKGTEKDHVIIHKQQRTTANTQSSRVFPGETAASVTTARSHASIDIDLVVLPMGGQHATPN